MKNKKALITWNPGKALVLVAALLLCSQLVFAPGGSGWVPSWTNQLGISLEHQPAVDEDFTQLKGKIEVPGKFTDIIGGIAGFKPIISTIVKGMDIKITYIDNVDWTTTIEGKTVKPAIVRFEIPGTRVSVKLAPQKNDQGEVILKPVKE